MPAKQDVDNPNAFKLWINRDVLVRMAKSISAVHPEFDQKKFIARARGLDSLELKPRVQLIRDQLRAQLPQDFLAALQILIASLQQGGLSGFALWPYTEFIQTYGLAHRQKSLDALATLTPLFTAEFAVRPFLKLETEATLAYLANCATSKNVHLRRWASEGSRPRLPWGERLDVFITAPEKTLAILVLLKNDDELYVRKSVANHLNDISKDSPKLVVSVLKRWNREAAPEYRDRIRWITHRALRTLIKKGDSTALAAIGVKPKTELRLSTFSLAQTVYKVGDSIDIEFELKSKSKKSQKLVIDYVVHFMKSNRSTAPKVFKLKSIEIAAGEVMKISKRHHLKLVTTRRFYPGAHAIEIQINGIIQARADWVLKT